MEENGTDQIKRRRKRFPAAILHTLLGVVLGALASWAISSYFANRPPASPLDLAREAKAALWEREFAEALSDYSRVLAVNPARSVYWEGKAYAHIGRAIGDEFDLGYLDEDSKIVQWIETLSTRNDKYRDLDQAYEAAEAAFNTASMVGERAAAQFILGLVRELRGNSDFSKHSFSPLRHYAAAIRDLHAWQTTQEYETATTYSSPNTELFVLPWGLPWQARTIRPLCTYGEALDSAFIRRVAKNRADMGPNVFKGILGLPELEAEYEQKLTSRRTQSSRRLRQ